ncbi:hypothetical protein LWF01_09975 [Saxibacter everestensis]|uniref:ATP/GTP-binding protein n=1 Tax=Saxibacter everestensis TaxID=2909229 RepID=A0ABY8QND6_9MICO|nr:hypothetical protein LWF01_09975 [Brevibacteriaceae bacterium ZFBP1038]
MPRSSSSRRASKYQRPRPEPRDLEETLAAMPRSVTAGDGEWTVQRVRGDRTSKTYRCPGCDQEIGPGVAHTVAWQSDSILGAEHALAGRRHWHNSCWQARGRRAPTRRR